MKTDNHIEELIERYPILESEKENILDAVFAMAECFKKDGKLLVAGNGGSASDAEHITGELMKSFRKQRRIPDSFSRKLKNIDSYRGEKLSDKLECGLMTIPLVTFEALSTAYMNDADGESIFAQLLYGYGRKNDVFLGISTSGNSENIVRAMVVAKALGIKTIGLTGGNGGRVAQLADICVCVPETETYKVQELHLPIYHAWCLALENRFF